MNLRQGWLYALMVLALLVAACGPEMATPTPGTTGGSEEATLPAPSAPPATSAASVPSQEAPPSEPVSVAHLVDEGDWHVLGAPDAQVTIVEYSDFQ
jgi:protein-disulfide isomerase